MVEKAVQSFFLNLLEKYDRHCSGLDASSFNHSTSPQRQLTSIKRKDVLKQNKFRN